MTTILTTLDPREIYLLELFVSPAYLANLRDTWGEMIGHVERCLDEYMQNLPSNSRTLSLPEQPDSVWGERVLHNFRSTYQNLCSGVIALTHGDLQGLDSANGPLNDHKGQREFSSEWMRPEDRERYFELLNRSSTIASNICATEDPYWAPGDLLNPAARGEISLPTDLPAYQLNKTVNVATAETVNRAGVYIPNFAASCPQFLSPFKNAPTATVRVGVEPLFHPSTGEKYAEEPIYESRDCIWTLIERGPSTEVKPQPWRYEASFRITGGEVCPESGYYFAPARADSKRFFARGTVMPTFAFEYGATIWQWDSQQ